MLLNDKDGVAPPILAAAHKHEWRVLRVSVRELCGTNLGGGGGTGCRGRALVAFNTGIACAFRQVI